MTRRYCKSFVGDDLSSSGETAQAFSVISLALSSSRAEAVTSSARGFMLSSGSAAGEVTAEGPLDRGLVPKWPGRGMLLQRSLPYAMRKSE